MLYGMRDALVCWVGTVGVCARGGLVGRVVLCAACELKRQQGVRRGARGSVESGTPRAVWRVTKVLLVSWNPPGCSALRDCCPLGPTLHPLPLPAPQPIDLAEVQGARGADGRRQGGQACLLSVLRKRGSRCTLINVCVPGGYGVWGGGHVNNLSITPALCPLSLAALVARGQGRRDGRKSDGGCGFRRHPCRGTRGWIPGRRGPPPGPR